LKTVKTERIFYVPGEHDVFLDGGTEYFARYGKGTVDGRGWQSFDYKGTHFVGLVNVLKYKGRGWARWRRAARVAGEGRGAALE